ncbi:hypothetical protein Droror1_Dr00024348 [Drosera rotundifolia]
MVVPLAKDMVTEGTLCIRDRSCSPDKGTNMQSSVPTSDETGSSSEDDDSTSNKEVRRGFGLNDKADGLSSWRGPILNQTEVSETHISSNGGI